MERLDEVLAVLSHDVARDDQGLVLGSTDSVHRETVVESSGMHQRRGMGELTIPGDK